MSNELNPPPPSSVDLSKLSKAELIEHLRTNSKDAVILAEMQRLGFWPKDGVQPNPASELIQRETELVQGLQALSAELRKVSDPVAALKAMRQERMAKARARREETRQKLAKQRFERAKLWQQRRQSEILYLGAGVSAGLQDNQSDANKLVGKQLPLLHNSLDLAQAMGITLAELRFLAFERRVSRISHYRRFAMPKKTGGERIISAPMPRLKRAQYWLLDNVLSKISLHPAAHGFVPGSSILSNALPHLAQAVVINLDLKDFFPSIKMPRIKGVFRMLGYSEQLASVMALLCTESACEEVQLDGETFFVAQGERALPQGAPSSPALTNILCRRLDARLQACAAKLGFQYTRYADDLTFSAPPAASKLSGKLLWRVKQIVQAEGFTPHPQKQHVMRSHECQQVTGIVVNQQASLPRETLKRFRATLFQVEKDGPQGKQWQGNPQVLSALEGYAQFIRMVDPVKGQPLLERVRAAKARWQAQEINQPSLRRTAKHRSDFRVLAAQGKAPWSDWWQNAPSALPVLEKTQAQVQEQKRQEKAAQLVSQAAAKLVAAETPSSKPAQNEPGSKIASTSESSLPTPLAMPWQALALQGSISITLGIQMKSLFALLAGLGLILLTLATRKPSWLRFTLIMLLNLLLQKK